MSTKKRIYTRSPDRLAMEMIEAVENEQFPLRAMEKAMAQIRVKGEPRKPVFRPAL